jgi:NADPH:quinone reductase-like Zn-dependent oxidoreductase
MRAARIHSLGDMPRIDEVADEPVSTDERPALRVRAAALNPLDLAVAAGRFYGGHPPFPYIPGSEAIVEKADGTRAWFFGDGAGVARDGTLAERAVVKADSLISIPEDTDDALAAALGIAGVAGWGAVQRARVGSGDRVLILGATGAVGMVALQGAKLFGAQRVVAVGRDAERLEETRELGADETVQLDADDVVARFKEASGGVGPTVVIDMLWNEPVAAAAEAAAPRARIVNVGQSAGPTAPLTSAAVRGKELDILGFSNFGRTPQELRELYLGLLEHAQAGRIRVPLEKFSLDEVDEAWRRQAAGAKSVVVL